MIANRALLVLTPVLYFATIVAYWAFAARVWTTPRRAPQLFLLATLVSHGGLCAARATLIDQLPWTTWHDVVLALAFVIAATYALVEIVTRDSATGSDVLPIPFFMTLYACAIGPHVPVANASLDTPMFALHTVPAIGGIGAVLASGLYGILYLRLAHAIRAKRFDAFFSRMPTLDILGRMNFWAAAIGVFLITAGIAVGAIWYGDLFERVDVAEPKIALVLIIWSVLTVTVLAQAFRRLPDHVAAKISVATLSLVVFFVVVLPFVAIVRKR